MENFPDFHWLVLSITERFCRLYQPSFAANFNILLTISVRLTLTRESQQWDLKHTRLERKVLLKTGTIKANSDEGKEEARTKDKQFYIQKTAISPCLRNEQRIVTREMARRINRCLA